MRRGYGRKYPNRRYGVKFARRGVFAFLGAIIHGVCFEGIYGASVEVVFFMLFLIFFYAMKKARKNSMKSKVLRIKENGQSF